jgi:serine/threonine protein kinase
MELLRGETLAERIRKGPLSIEQALQIGRQICQALQAAHRAGVVHRDLKPQNVWITESGDVKLLDFGLARAAGLARLTAQSTVLGTPGYVAPEILSGAGADPRSDLYSLGATLFEMVTGQRAFPYADPYRVMRGQRQPPPSAKKLRSDVPGALDALIARAMDPDPEQRFADARQMERALAGKRAADAPRVPEALVAGRFEVVVHRNAR